MQSSLPKSVLLLYFSVNKYLDIKNEHRLRTGEFTKNIIFLRLTDIDLILSSIGKISRAVSNLEWWEYLLRPRKTLTIVPWSDSSLPYISIKTEVTPSDHLVISSHTEVPPSDHLVKCLADPSAGVSDLDKSSWFSDIFRLYVSWWQCQVFIC